jgi:hypothetical protein
MIRFTIRRTTRDDPQHDWDSIEAENVAESVDFETFEIEVPELELLLKHSRGENGYFDKSELVDAEFILDTK